MNVNIEIGTGGDRQWCRTGEHLTFGSSPQTQVTVGDSALGARHFTVEPRPDGCWLECHDTHSVLVNGAKTAAVRLRNGDRIYAGNTTFGVSIEGDIEVPQVEQEPPLYYVQSRLSTGVMLLQSHLTLADPAKVIGPISQGRRVFLLANYRQAKVQSPSSATEKGDLFRHAPAEIRQEHSLHLIPGMSFESILRDYLPLRTADAAVIVFSQKRQEELAESLKFYFAWYVRPSILQFQLREGTADLAKKVLAGVDAVFAEPAEAEGWWLAANPELASPWEALGLPVPPANAA